MKYHIKFVDQLSKVVKRNKENQHMEKCIFQDKKGGIFWVLLVFSYFPELNQIFGQEILLFLSPQVQDPLNGEIKILLNLNCMWIKLIQACTMTSQSIKDISGMG